MRNVIVDEDLQSIVDSGLPWDQFAGKTVLVTGANGCLPAFMLETLLYLNETQGLKIRVIGLVRNIDKAKARFLAYTDRDDLQLVAQDLALPLKIHYQVDVIIHAASQASPSYYDVDPVGTLMPNVIGTANLLRLAQDNEVSHFLFFSSGEVYGEMGENQISLDETTLGGLDTTSVRSCYAESKRMGETMCAAWHHQYGVAARIVRPFHTYGPGMQLGDGRVHSDFVSDILNDRSIVMKSAGDARRSFCYLADAVSGFFTVMLCGNNGEAYNIGNEDAELSILELAHKLVALFPEKNLEVVKCSKDDKPTNLQAVPKACPDTSKARALGWQARTGVDAGFLRTVQSFT